TPDDKARPFNRAARFYDAPDALVLSAGEIERTEKDAAIMHLKEAKRKFKGFDSLPFQARQVILDMEFNMGSRFTAARWPSFFAAVKDGRWEDAANNTRSSQIGEDRNNWRRDTIQAILRLDLRFAGGIIHS
ncbi:MAG: hypothetical protein FWF01_04135, partial [Alphaproteobacteria bacterium]|nr:hypothetical protein [Alphaproteobacteria bacterium]